MPGSERSSARRDRSALLAGLIAVALGVGVAVLAIRADDGGDQPDKGSAIACAHFRSIAGDALGGSLDPEAVRETFARIDAQATDATPAVQRAARRMLQAADDEDPGMLIDRSHELAAACGDAGQ